MPSPLPACSSVLAREATASGHHPPPTRVRPAHGSVVWRAEGMRDGVMAGWRSVGEELQGLPPTQDITAVTMEQIIAIRGSQATPVTDITLSGITFRGAAKTMLSPHESTTSGADWAAPRRAAVAIEGAIRVQVENCAFETLGGSAVLWSNFVRASTVRNCSFSWLGGNAVLAMGTDQFGDATDGEHPFNNTVDACFARELGVFAKHSGFYAEFVAGAVDLRRNIAFVSKWIPINCFSPECKLLHAPLLFWPTERAQSSDCTK
eukprot:SAG31_NODE_6308_length_2072_cov_1.463254_2_plen_263_part_00